jgi:cytochrome c5
VKAQCVKCHGKGLNGAPKIGDKAAWIDRAKLGFDSVVRSAINGHGAMPSRGGMPNLTDSEMRAAVTYMFQQSVKNEAPAKK